MVDGTTAGFGRCSASPTAQNPGSTGRNGVQVFKVDGVSVENLTVCNFLAGSGGNGNEIWFNGGDGSGLIGMGGYRGAWLTASSTFFQSGSSNLAMYGIFASNSRGPGLFTHTYSSNMADSSYYVGACPDCNATLGLAHAENSALGYSGSNAGGHLTIEFSEFDNNRSGIGPNSLNNEDAPSPQNGACPNDPTKSCSLFQFNVPAPLGPACYFVAYGNRVIDNQLFANGFFGNPTNSDLADATAEPAAFGLSVTDNCFARNVDLRTGVPSSNPAHIESRSVLGTCGATGHGGDMGELFNQVTCSAFGLCPAGGSYPQTTTVRMLPIPDDLQSMPNPCVGVPANPWCSD